MKGSRASPQRLPRAVRKRAPAPRTRRSAADARARILDAAERALMRVGPEGLRLTELARELRVSHPAILHHFGSREGLVAAVVRRTMEKLTADLLAELRDAAPDRDRLLDQVAEVCTTRGLARLIAWLMLSGRAESLHRLHERPLQRLAEVAHALRVRHAPAAQLEDTQFVLQLLAVALLGDAIFGEPVRRASGTEPTAAAAQDFRRRLAQLLPA